jgi:hypothetical protein
MIQKKAGNSVFQIRLETTRMIRRLLKGEIYLAPTGACKPPTQEGVSDPDSHPGMLFDYT